MEGPRPEDEGPSRVPAMVWVWAYVVDDKGIRGSGAIVELQELNVSVRETGQSFRELTSELPSLT